MATTTTYSLEKPTVGGSENTWGTDWNDNADKIDDLLDGTTAIKPNLDEGLWEVGGVAVTATAAELNILDGVTASTAELNILDGVTASAAELNILDGVTATTAELNILDGVTATAAELNILDGVTATTAEINILDGVTATATEINLVDGLTAIVTEASGIASNDNDTTLPTSAAVKDYVDALTSGASLGDVGTYAWLVRTSTAEADYITQGATYAGSLFYYSGISRSGGNNIITGAGTSPAGTWRAMGVMGAAFAGTNYRATLFLRIS